LEHVVKKEWCMRKMHALGGRDEEEQDHKKTSGLPAIVHQTGHGKIVEEGACLG
jgi:hypothetical protein